MAMDLKWILSAQDNASSVFDKVKQSGEGMASGVEGVVSKFNLLTGAIGGMAAIAGGMALKSIVSEYVNWELSVAKLANTMGTSTDEASAFAVALHTYGIENDVAEKAALKLAKTMGTNEAVFEKLGVEIKDAEGNLRSTAEVMPEVNTALADMKAGTDRNVVAMELYGKSWGEVRQLLKVTEEAMKEAKETAERLHLVVGDEGVAKAKEYKKNLNEIELVAKSLKIQVGEELLPALVELGAYMSKNGPQIAEFFGMSLQFVTKVIQSIGAEIDVTAERLIALKDAVVGVVTGEFSDASYALGNFVDAGERNSKRIKDIWTNWDHKSVKSKTPDGDILADNPEAKAEQAEKDYLETVKASIKGITEYAAALKDLGKQRLEFFKEDYADKLKQELELYKEGAAAIGDLAYPLRRYNVEVNDIYNQRLQVEKSALDKLAGVYDEFKKNVVMTGSSKEAMNAENEILTAYKKTAENIISVESDRYKTLLEGERKYANEVLGLIQAKKNEIKELQNRFADANAIWGEKSAVLKKDYSGQYAYLDPKLDAYQKQAAMVEKLKNDEQAADQINDPARKKEKLTSLIAEYEKVAETVAKEGDNQARNNMLVDDMSQKRDDIQNKIAKAAQDEKTALEDAYGTALSKVDEYKSKLVELDDLIKSLSQDVVINMKVNGAEAIQAIAGSVAMASGGSDYSGGGGDIASFDVGTNYVPKTGLALIHKGEAIIPAGQNNGGSMSFGDVSISLPNVTNQTSAAELARQVMPELQKLQQRMRRV